MSSRWSEMFSNPWQAGITVYLIIGLVVVGIVSFRGMRLRPPPNSGPLWEQKDNTRNTLFLFLAGKVHPIGVVIEIVLWPLWLVLLLLSR